MSIQRPNSMTGKPPQKPSAAGVAKPKKKLQLDVNDVDSVLERKISP